jgi:acyl carrier protein
MTDLGEHEGLLRDRILRLFQDTLNLQVASPTVDLLETGLLDSLTFVQLLFHIEQEFGVTVGPDELEIENFRSVAEIARFVATRK